MNLHNLIIIQNIIVFFFAPIADWKGNSSNSEQSHTGYFLKTIKKNNYIHYNRIDENIWVGSCPRKLEHIYMLKSEGITAVINLQSLDDIQNNCPNIDNWYRDAELPYIWLPTEDFNRSKSIIPPHAVFILNGLIENGHKVYVHCTGGIDKSIGVICGYYSIIKRLPIRELGINILSKRVVSLIDEESIIFSLEDYGKKFVSK